MGIHRTKTLGGHPGRPAGQTYQRGAIVGGIKCRKARKVHNVNPDSSRKNSKNALEKPAEDGPALLP